MRVKRNNARMVRWTCNVRPEDRISAGNLRVQEMFTG